MSGTVVEASCAFLRKALSASSDLIEAAKQAFIVEAQEEMARGRGRLSVLVV